MAKRDLDSTNDNEVLEKNGFFLEKLLTIYDNWLQAWNSLDVGSICHDMENSKSKAGKFILITASQIVLSHHRYPSRS